MPSLGVELGHRLGVHAGLASGVVLAADTGSTGHREYTVTGDAANLAARLADAARAIEFKYAHNPGKARETLARELPQLGATLKDGKWWYKDAPVAITLLIRTEDVRKRIGDYMATILEDLGFTVDRQYKSAAEAGPIWIGSDP